MLLVYRWDSRQKQNTENTKPVSKTETLKCESYLELQSCGSNSQSPKSSFLSSLLLKIL